jgi:hypothetical protein
VNPNDTAALLLLALQGIALGIGFMILGWMFALHRRTRRPPANRPVSQNMLPRARQLPCRPTGWLAVRSASPEAVRLALGVRHAEPCSWNEGLAGHHGFFISPRVHGWVIVTGLALPNPTDDVDATFLFLTALSRQLGHVQYFYASRLLHHHAWARLDDGYVTRAYAWTGETSWNQGVETLPEIEADLKLFAYGDSTATRWDAEANFEKVPRLAARWSLDPAAVKMAPFRQSAGLAGEPACF